MKIVRTSLNRKDGTMGEITIPCTDKKTAQQHIEALTKEWQTKIGNTKGHISQQGLTLTITTPRQIVKYQPTA